MASSDPNKLMAKADKLYYFSLLISFSSSSSFVILTASFFSNIFFYYYINQNKTESHKVECRLEICYPVIRASRYFLLSPLYYYSIQTHKNSCFWFLPFLLLWYIAIGYRVAKNHEKAKIAFEKASKGQEMLSSYPLLVLSISFLMLFNEVVVVVV